MWQKMVLGALVRAMGDGWVVGVNDLVGLFQPWGFCDSVKMVQHTLMEAVGTEWRQREMTERGRYTAEKQSTLLFLYSRQDHLLGDYSQQQTIAFTGKNLESPGKKIIYFFHVFPTIRWNVRVDERNIFLFASPLLVLFFVWFHHL